MCMIVQQSMVRLSGLTLFLSIFANNNLSHGLTLPKPLSLSLALPPYLLGHSNPLHLSMSMFLQSSFAINICIQEPNHGIGIKYS